MRGVLALGAFCGLLLAPAACGRSGGDAAEDAAEQVAETPVEAFFRYGPAVQVETRAELAAALGAPDSVQVDTVANRHDPGVTDSVITLHYPGLSHQVYRATYDGREFRSEVTITADQHLRPDSPLRFGITGDEIRLLLGEPSDTTDGLLRYACTSCNAAGSDVLELALRRGTLQRITMRFWID